MRDQKLLNFQPSKAAATAAVFLGFQLNNIKLSFQGLGGRLDGGGVCKRVWVQLDSIDKCHAEKKKEKD